ncbi:hypothetical protein VNO78_07339 [Psophocarpus tetragonolobus]|uniref:Uncharacterized protein n=1 Tax=Psophocarpus tetragonolobus TaxID=3891 RepID=A0AAN9STA3_PSOTE
MTNKGPGGGRNPPNCGRGHGASWRHPVTTTSVHISSAESAIPVVRQGQGSLPSVQEFVIPANVEGSIPLSREPTPKYPPVVESTQPVDSRPLLQVLNGEFTPDQGVSHIICEIIKAKFDEPCPNFKNKSAISKANRALDSILWWLYIHYSSL